MSSTPTVNQNNPSVQKDLSDLLADWRKNIMLTLNCHHLGTIQSFNANTVYDNSTPPKITKFGQTVTATVDYTKTFFKLNTETGSYFPYQVSYPVIIDAPVIFLTGGGSGDTAPVAKGDECLIIFNDRNMDTWLQGVKGSSPVSFGLHAFSDALVIVGPRSGPNSLKNFDPVRAVKRGGTAVMGVNPTINKILLTNVAPTVAGDGSLSYPTTFNTMIQNLCTQLQNLTGALAALTVMPGSFNAPSGGGPVTGTSGAPTNASTISNIGTQISNIATQLGGLLE